jgi:hypothetical protein
LAIKEFMRRCALFWGSWRLNILASYPTILVVILDMLPKVVWFFSNVNWPMVERILEK